MKTDMKGGASPSHEWLQRMGDQEDACSSISVGGLVHDLGLLQASHLREMRRGFGKLVELARRRRGWSMEELAKRIDVDLAELVAIERDEPYEPKPRTVHKLAEGLDLPVSRLLQLSGLTEGRNETLSRAALRFAARAEPTTKLSKSEQEALEEFVKVLAEATDGG